MNNSNTVVSLFDDHRRSSWQTVLVCALLFGLNGSLVWGQQSYIPYTDRPVSDTETVPPLVSSPRKKQTDAVTVRRAAPDSIGVASLPPLPGQRQPGALRPSAFNADVGRFFSAKDSQAVETQRTDPATPPLPPASPSDVTTSASNGTIPVQPPPTPPSPLPPGYVLGVTSVPVVPPGPPGSFDAATTAYESFGSRLFKAYFGEKDDGGEAEPSHREGAIVPFDSPPFPFSDYIGPVIGYRDTTVYPLMQAVYEGPNGDWWKKSRIKIYGWADPSVTFGTSKASNIPLSYSIVPNSLQLSQAILVFERVTDSVQTDHCDWGFKLTNLFGIDYRYTTAKGWFSDQLLKHNNLYGYDPLQLYADFYVPWVRQGMIIRFGRFISPLDIEAQLTTDNYLYTHSLMYTYDPYTFTGMNFSTKLSDQYTLLLGVQAGNDMAPWTRSSQANGMAMLKWVSKSGNDSLWGGLDSIGKGYYSKGHDDLQVAGLVWGHKFNDRLHTMTEAYYIWERDALSGGTVVNGPPAPYFPSTGPGKLIPGLSNSIGCVNYTAYKTSDKSYLVHRWDVLDDPQGFRTGFPGAYFENTLGFIYHLTPWCVTRPEVRLDYTSGQKAYDNGTKREQFTFNWDIIIRF